MSLPEALLDVLACPKCHRRVEPTDDELALECPNDKLRFPIVGGIPVMLLEKATPA